MYQEHKAKNFTQHFCVSTFPSAKSLSLGFLLTLNKNIHSLKGLFLMNENKLMMKVNDGELHGVILGYADPPANIVEDNSINH